MFLILVFFFGLRCLVLLWFALFCLALVCLALVCLALVCLGLVFLALVFLGFPVRITWILIASNGIGSVRWGLGRNLSRWLGCDNERACYSVFFFCFWLTDDNSLVL